MRPWVTSTSPGVPMREKPAARPPDSVLPWTFSVPRGQSLGAFFKQVWRHALPPRSFLIKPTTPLGRNSVTPMNIAPRKYSQNSG